MSKILSIENKKFYLKDLSNNSLKTFSNENEAFDFLKDNYNLQKENIIIDNKLSGGQKIILKNIYGKAKKYQETNQMDDFYFEVKKNINDSLSQNISPDGEISSEKKLKVINDVSNQFAQKIDTVSNQNVICKLLADITLEETEKIFQKFESKITNEELFHLKAVFNTLINRNYLSHRKNNIVYDLVELRNKVSSLLLKRGIIG
ncbi:MAG TPA: hypothetical protein PLD27_01610 [bacterium]|nr:hypothetical protein [bacterium]HOL46591.1 hypothetical protein [bacterium]HPQ17838.1 hypothetical protein [bacterium]